MAPRDSQRQKVYAAEHVLWQVLDNSRDNSSYTIEGINLTLPPEGKFGSLESVQGYVDRVLAHPAVIERFPWTENATITVRRRKGATKAHYERLTQTIAVPDQIAGGSWAMREMVILHEVAHAVSWDAHGPQFVSAFVSLLEATMGPEIGLVMRILFRHNGVREGHQRGDLAGR